MTVYSFILQTRY